MIASRYRWRVAGTEALSDGFAQDARARGIGAAAAAILAARGVGDAASLDAFLGPPEAGLHDPRLLPDADRTVERIRRAIRDREGVLVFGDFDADGLTGLAVLVRALRALGLDAAPYVPSRLLEGHGLSVAAVERARADGRTLIVTVDCGSSSPDEVEAARRAGIDVIVTDHHHVPERVPDAAAFVNPHRPDAVYPDARLAGAGVAFTVARLLHAEIGGAWDPLALADLATIGTVGDVAPILGENRAIARIGLRMLREAPRPALAALLARTGVRPEAADLETVAFQIAPRLNAAGRVGEAEEAAGLLLTDDAGEAEAIAGLLEAANDLRRELLRTSLAEARTSLAAGELPPDAPAIALQGPWAPGIVGLIAARLAEEHGRPAVIGARLDGIVRASCRSGGRLDLAAALDACGDDLFLRHGGHAGAAGFDLPAERWETFLERFSALAAAAAPADPRPELAVDLAIATDALDHALVRDLRVLEPTGPGNPAPVVAVSDMTVTRVRAATGGHAQITLRRKRDVVDAIAFGRDDLAAQLREGDRLDVAARVGIRAFGGYDSLELEVRDVAPAGTVQPARWTHGETGR
jgi:single-stranded-DNA-specific exonuclease